MRRVMLWAICSFVAWAPVAAQAQLYTGDPIQAPCSTLSDCLQKGYKFTSVSERSETNGKGEKVIFRTFWFQDGTNVFMCSLDWNVAQNSLGHPPAPQRCRPLLIPY